MSKRIEYLEKLWFFLLCSLITFPILPRGVESVIMITIAVVSILLITAKNGRIRQFRKIDGYTVILTSILPITFFLSLTYTNNLTEGLGQILLVAPLLLFSLVFGFVRKSLLTEQERVIIKIIYVLSVSLALIWLQILLLEPLFDPGISNWELRQLIEKNSGVHGTYLSIWIGFALIVLLTIKERHLRMNKFISYSIIILLIGFFIFWQIKIGARTPLLATAFLLFVYIIVALRKKLIPLIIFLLIVGSGIYYMSNKIQVLTRTKEAFSLDQHQLPEGDYSYNYKNISSEDIRKGIYICSWNLIVQSPWLGYGVGDVQGHLDDCYRENISSNVYQKFLYNTHNQYFHVQLATGVFALILFIMSLLWPLILSLKHKDFLLFSITSLILICLLTENVLSRHDGVIFYSLFSSMLIFNSLRRYEEGISS